MFSTPFVELAMTAYLVMKFPIDCRENEWMFSTDEGRLELSSSCGYQRLLVVTLNRGHVYKDIDEVKAELSAKVMELAPRGTLEKDVCCPD